MTRFTFQGSGQTTGGGEGLVALVAVGAGAAIAYAAARSAAATLGELLVVIPVAIGGTVLGAVVTLLAVRLRGRRRATTQAQPGRQLWQANPQAIPVQPRREIPAPVQPVVNINLGADVLAGLLRAAQQQPAPVSVRAEHEELPR